MPRPREFDADDVLDAVMHAFWERGYEATSVRDLVHAAGINRGSLYAEFGDKHALFLRALTSYAETVVPTRRDLLEQPGGGLQSIRDYFEAVIGDLLTDQQQKGCFLVNSATELAPHDRLVARLVRAHLERLEEAFRGALRAAIERSELPPDTSVDAQAALLLAVSQGLMVIGKTDPSRRRLRAIVDSALAGLD